MDKIDRDRMLRCCISTIRLWNSKGHTGKEGDRLNCVLGGDELAFHDGQWVEARRVDGELDE